MLSPAQRISNIPPYAFAELGRKIEALTATGVEVIRLDIGNPDLPPAPHILATLMQQTYKPDTHGYGGYIGLPALREAIAFYYQQRFGVSLDPTTEVLPLIGSKEGLANLHLAWLDADDLVLIPDPGYIVYKMAPRLVGANVHSIPLTAANNWLPNFEAIPPDVARRARMMWLNYPNNPTGAVADLAFFARAVAFCRQHQILLCHDNPYCEITFDGYRPVSPLQVEGAKEVVIEFNSLSKTYNMAGWRVGLAVGNQTAIAALRLVKSQIDSGLGLPVQHMAVTALTGDQTWLQARNQTYQERRDLVVETLREVGLPVTPPQATLYIWFQVPTGYNDVTFHQLILDKAHISIAPGSIYGPGGVGWMRLSISVATLVLERALTRLKEIRW